MSDESPANMGDESPANMDDESPANMGNESPAETVSNSRTPPPGHLAGQLAEIGRQIRENAAGISNEDLVSQFF